MEGWAQWAGVERREAQRQFLKGAATRGLPKKAKQVIYKLLWKRVVWRGPGGEHACRGCGDSYAGEAEQHVFFECRDARAVWAAVMEKVFGCKEGPSAGELMGAGFWREALVGLPQAKVWRKVWACTLWGLWRRFCEQRFGEEKTEERMLRWVMGIIVETIRDCILVQVRSAEWGSPTGAELSEECRRLWAPMGLVRLRGGLQGAGEDSWISAGGDAPT